MEKTQGIMEKTLGVMEKTKGVKMSFKVSGDETAKLFTHINRNLTFFEGYLGNQAKIGDRDGVGDGAVDGDAVWNGVWDGDGNGVRNEDMFIHRDFLKPKTLSKEAYLQRCVKGGRIFRDDGLIHREKSCNICLNQLVSGFRELRELSCKHVFHRKCVDEWFYANLDDLSCPCCRQSQYSSLE
jgi:hypothetical protein